MAVCKAISLEYSKKFSSLSSEDYKMLRNYFQRALEWYKKVEFSIMH